MRTVVELEVTLSELRELPREFFATKYDQLKFVYYLNKLAGEIATGKMELITCP